MKPIKSLLIVTCLVPLIAGERISLRRLPKEETKKVDNSQHSSSPSIPPSLSPVAAPIPLKSAPALDVVENGLPSLRPLPKEEKKKVDDKHHSSSPSTPPSPSPVSAPMPLKSAPAPDVENNGLPSPTPLRKEEKKKVDDKHHSSSPSTPPSPSPLAAPIPLTSAPALDVENNGLPSLRPLPKEEKKQVDSNNHSASPSIPPSLSPVAAPIGLTSAPTLDAENNGLPQIDQHVSPPPVLTDELMTLFKFTMEISAEAFEELPRIPLVPSGVTDFKTFLAEPDQTLFAKYNNYCVVAFRGLTDSIADYLQILYPDLSRACPPFDEHCSCYFRTGWVNSFFTPYFLELEQDLQNCMHECDGDCEMLITGASAGAATASLASVYFAEWNPLTIHYGSPSSVFPGCEYINSERTYRLVNTAFVDDAGRLGYDHIAFNTNVWDTTRPGRLISMSSEPPYLKYEGTDNIDYRWPICLSCHRVRTDQGTPCYKTQMANIYNHYSALGLHSLPVEGFQYESMEALELARSPSMQPSMQPSTTLAPSSLPSNTLTPSVAPSRSSTPSLVPTVMCVRHEGCLEGSFCVKGSCQPEQLARCTPCDSWLDCESGQCRYGVIDYCFVDSFRNSHCS